MLIIACVFAVCGGTAIAGPGGHGQHPNNNHNHTQFVSHVQTMPRPGHVQVVHSLPPHHHHHHRPHYHHNVTGDVIVATAILISALM